MNGCIVASGNSFACSILIPSLEDVPKRIEVGFDSVLGAPIHP